MNSLTFEQRQVVEADIHGVGDVIEETATFIHDKIELMQEALAQLRSPGKLDAWERAIFLRPSLEQDRKIHLMFLRACKFQPNDAAILMAAYYREKRILFGDDLLIHRITWNDVRFGSLLLRVQISRLLCGYVTHPLLPLFPLSSPRGNRRSFDLEYINSSQITIEWDEVSSSPDSQNGT